MNYKITNNNFFKVCKILFLLIMVVLFFVAHREYRGEGYIYVLFTISSFALLYLGFRKNAIFFDTFIGIFFWLGFWLKLTLRTAFMDSQFHSLSIGGFGGTGSEFDRVLLISSCGFLGLIFASYLRERFLFKYPSTIRELGYQGLYRAYKKYRKVILIGFVLLFGFVALTNSHYGIYQRGSISSMSLPYGLNGVYKWLLLFGLTSLSALALRFEYEIRKTTATYFIAVIALIEIFVSNVSLLSRGMLLNASALMYGVYRAITLYDIKTSARFISTIVVLFLVLFVSSVVTVNYIRAENFSDDLNDFSNTSSQLDEVASSTKRLFLERWVGIEGVMAVSSYREKGWSLWGQAWDERYSENKTSFYDLNLITSPYRNTDMTKHHFVSLPGIIAFCFYPGSFVFLFICLFVVGIFSALMEMFVYRLGGKNVILCALLAQVIAFRFASFGYVPVQSYLLFGTILMSIVIFYVTDKFLALRFKDNNDQNI